MHRGPAGAGNLNLLLQEALTLHAEGRPERRYGSRVFRVGDVITIKRVFRRYWSIADGRWLANHSA